MYDFKKICNKPLLNFFNYSFWDSRTLLNIHRTIGCLNCMAGQDQAGIKMYTHYIYKYIHAYAAFMVFYTIVSPVRGRREKLILKTLYGRL
jgi:hypothetical protein